MRVDIWQLVGYKCGHALLVLRAYVRDVLPLEALASQYGVPQKTEAANIICTTIYRHLRDHPIHHLDFH